MSLVCLIQYNSAHGSAQNLLQSPNRPSTIHVSRRGEEGQLNGVQVRFSPKCRSNISVQQRRRMADWRLDFNLRKNCAGNVKEFCNDSATGNQTADGRVLQCLSMHHGSLDMECAVTVTRSIHTALNFYYPVCTLTRHIAAGKLRSYARCLEK